MISSRITSSKISGQKRKAVEDGLDRNMNEEDVLGIDAAYERGDRATVHWDPDSDEGKLVGNRLRVLDETNHGDIAFKEGRIIAYDSFTNMHKIMYKATCKSEWLFLEEETVQLYGDIVWAKVKGFSWWPAQILIRDDTDEIKADILARKQDSKWVRVAFFDHPDVSDIKDSPTTLKRFTWEDVENVPKKKNILKAYRDAVIEMKRSHEARSVAIKDLSWRAFQIACNVSNNMLGKNIELFDPDINYPAGKVLTGIVRNYSPATNKWLISYDDDKYEPCWKNLFAPIHSYKLIGERKLSIDPNPSDLAPFTFGLESDSEQSFKDHCMSCVRPVASKPVLSCYCCSMNYHPFCLDPPISAKEMENIKDKWVCDKCTECTGCGQFDIVFGSIPFSPRPKSLAIDEPILCASCIPQYQMERYCPNCGHCWDESRYEKIQKEIERQKRKKDGKCIDSTSSKKSKINRKSSDNHESSESSAKCVHRNLDPSNIELSKFRPDSCEWGFNEGAMLACDSCNLWVHAGCAGLSETEYEETNSGVHPIYTKEFLCKSCSKRRAEVIIKNLQMEDTMGLFAMPVTEEMAPTYRDVVKRPMDLHTMMRHCSEGRYLNYFWVRQLFELMVHNALIFNRPNSKYWNEAKRYYKICLSRVFEVHGKYASSGDYASKIEKEFDVGKLQLTKEQERLQQDKTVKKKDLVIGEAVKAIDLQKTLATPIDPSTCVPFTEVQLNLLDAHFVSWMEMCYTCGSSGAQDTMLFCIDCGEGYHSFCVNAPIMSMTEDSILAWRCPNCKIDEITGGAPLDETKLLYCEMCDRGFTLDLLDPPLRSVPPGLWICGNCVDCKDCHNTSETKISLKYWSRNPQRCYHCGGCSGIATVDSLLKDRQCTVCMKYFRKDEPGLLKCRKCKLHVHLKCEPTTVYLTKDNEKWKSFCLRYECRQCREKIYTYDEKTLMAPESRMKSIEAKPVPSPLTFDVMTSVTHFAPYIHDEVMWQVKSLWASEYQAIAVDGVRIFLDAKQSLGQGWESVVLTQDTRIPDWVLHRSARWMRFVKNSIREHEKEKQAPVAFDSQQVKQFFTSYHHISSLVNDAKNAAAFIYLACIYLRSDVKTQCKYRDRLRALVVPTDINGTSQFPKDSLNIISPFIEQLEQEDISQEETAAEALMRLVISDKSGTENKPQADPYEQSISIQQKHGSLMVTTHTPEAGLEAQNNETEVFMKNENISKSSIDKKEMTKNGHVSEPLIEKTKTVDKACQDAHDITIQTLQSRPTSPDVARTESLDNRKLNLERSDDICDEQILIEPRDEPSEQPNGIQTHINTSKKQLIYGIKPLRGWGKDIELSSGKKWYDPRKCCLCMLCGDDDAGLMCDTTNRVGAGRLLHIPGGNWIHANCALWSSEVWDSGRGELKAVDKAKARGGKLKCFGCGRNGASIGCAKPACSANYHFLCAIACGVTLTESQNVFCTNHSGNADKILTAKDTSFEVMRAMKVVIEGEPERSNSALRIGTLVVHSLGSIEQDIDGFHSAEHIMPNGYVATRIFWSCIKPRTRTLYVLKIDKDIDRLPLFSIIPADNLKSPFIGRSSHEAYDKMMKCIHQVNQDSFSQNDLYSKLPMRRVPRNNPPDFMLNAPQFFGFGMNSIRKAIEELPGAISTCIPLTPKSPQYKFCFSLPNKKDAHDIQRIRAAQAAERVLDNITGCARTEGLNAVRKSGGSGRITRALVKNADIQDENLLKTSRKPDEEKIETESSSFQTKYKEIKSIPMSERLIAKRSHIHGWGLFTNIDIAKNSMVVEYMGETIRQCIADKREREYEKSGIGSCYMFRLDLQRIVDATMIGCMARFMNHCCQPNAYAKVVNVDNGFGIEKKIIIFAKRDIASGEEITYDYKFPVEDGSLRCTCGAPNCIGRMN